MSDDKIAEAFANTELSDRDCTFGGRYVGPERARAMAFHMGARWAQTFTPAAFYAGVRWQASRCGEEHHPSANSDLAAARAVTGPSCPKCGRFLLVEHFRTAPDLPPGFVTGSPHCLVTDDELRAQWPEIARELAL